MAAYYNEHDAYAAQWIRNLIAAGHVAPGDVDERDIRDVRPDELRGYAQCHFFAGISVWSHALRRAGWADDRPIWTGSCPCQPFSAAGKRGGTDDERHLWPHWFWLISQCRPPVVVGEQVASKDGLGWLDLVQADLEGADYAVGASDLCAAGFAQAHLRQRLYFTGMAHHHHPRLEGRFGVPERRDQRAAGPRGVAGRLADADGRQRAGLAAGQGRQPDRTQAGWLQGDSSASDDRTTGGLVDAEHVCAGRDSGDGDRAQTEVDGKRITVNGPIRDRSGLAGAVGGLVDADMPSEHGGPPSRKQPIRDERDERDEDVAVRNPGPIAARWQDVDWLLCRNPAGEPSWRPVEPGTFPLAHGVASRMGKLRAFGNALDAETATQFASAVRAIDDYLAVV